MLSRTPLYARRVAAALGAPHSRFLSAGPSYLELNEGQKKLSDIVAGSPKVLAYFTASWCGPCKAIGPHFAALAKDNGQAVQFVKVDIDDNATTTEEVRLSALRRPAGMHALRIARNWVQAGCCGCTLHLPSPAFSSHFLETLAGFLPLPNGLRTCQASISSVPTFKSFAHGKVVGQFTGANKDTLTAAVKSLVDA